MFGSAVESRLTVDGDVDVLIVLDEIPRSGIERARLVDRIWSVAVPFHLVSREELEMFRKSSTKMLFIHC